MIIKMDSLIMKNSSIVSMMLKMLGELLIYLLNVVLSGVPLNLFVKVKVVLLVMMLLLLLMLG
jgi:hypothetical protein